MKQRILTAAIFTPLMLILLVLHPTVARGTLVFIALFSLYELRQAFACLGIAIQVPLLSAYVIANFMRMPWDSEFFFAALLIYLAVLLGVACLQYPRFSLMQLGLNLLAALYPLPALLCAWQLRLAEHGREAMLLALVFTWAYDSSAYLGGTCFGKHYLFPLLSPKKSGEGVLCGILGTVLTGFAFIAVFPHFTPGQIVPIAFVAALLAQLGDLVESMFKRFCGIKDSGNLLPGHGGILDRFDAFFFVVIWVHAVYTLWRV